MKKNLLLLLLIALLTSFTSPIGMVNFGKASITLTIDGVEPAEPKQLPYKQWLSILGSGFTRESSVNLSIGEFNRRVDPERTEYINPNKIYVLVGLTEAGTWNVVVENPGGLLSNTYSFEVKPAKTLATIDECLLDLIDQYAGDYFRDIWNITLDQFKAWIATIAWGEGNLGGYVAHSQYLGEDMFYHKNETVKEKFRFSTGIGPFQIDRGGEPDNWHNWPTIKKLNYIEALNTTLRWHNRTFYSRTDATLEDFSSVAGKVWFAVQLGIVEKNWKEVTGTNWIDHKNGKNEALKWNEIKEDLKTKYPSYDENVEETGEVKWDLTFVTSEGKEVSFKSYYPTWLITARNSSGYKLFEYYYTYDDALGCEIWVWNNAGKDEFRHVFVRNYTKDYPKGALPENYTSGDSAGFTASKPALNPNLVYAPLGLDLIFTIDTTGSMWDDIDNVKAAASAIVEEIDAKISDYRIAIVDYKDFPVYPYGDTGDYPFHDVLPFSTDESSIIAAIQALTVGGGADWEESVYSALMHSIDATSLGGWRGKDKAAKIIILMGDAPPHDPEPFTGYTLSTVVDAAEKADPVHVYPIQIAGVVEKFEEIAEQTGGRAFIAESAEEVVDTILEALEVIAKAPVAEAGPDQTVYQGKMVTLDGSGSYDPDGIIVLYEWDAEGDGIYEWSSSTTGITTHLYETPGTYHATLRVTDDNGLQDTDFAIITVEKSPDEISPTTTLSIGEPHYVDPMDNIYISSVTAFTLIAEDNPGGTGVASTFYRIYNSTYDTGWLEYSMPFYLTGLFDGEYSIDYYSTDTIGNTEETNTATVILDNTPPTTTLTVGEPKYISDTTYVTPGTPFTLEATDTGSGVHSTFYRIFNATYDSGWLVYTMPFYPTSLTDGAYTIEYNSTDNVQNVETTQAINVTLFSWNYMFEDTYGRGTILKISIAHKFFQFITPDKDYGIRNATYMQVCGRAIIIRHYDSELRLITTAVDTKLDFCIAIAWDMQTRKQYFLIDKIGSEQ